MKKRPNESRIEMLEEIVKELFAAIYSALAESNGIYDNEWRTADGVVVPEWPIDGFVIAMAELNKAYELAHEYLNPGEEERRQKWKAACETARYIVKHYENDGKRMRSGSLQRNIADAIVGNLSTADKLVPIWPQPKAEVDENESR